MKIFNHADKNQNQFTRLIVKNRNIVILIPKFKLFIAIVRTIYRPFNSIEIYLFFYEM
jgi:hypothetical protein